MAVSELNTYRSTRAEDLGDGYEVSDILMVSIELQQALPIQCLQELVFTPIVQEVLVKFMDGMTSVQFQPSWKSSRI